MAVGDLGTMALAGDPGGAAAGFWQPGTFAGFGVLGEPGTPAWFELLTRDYQGAVASTATCGRRTRSPWLGPRPG